MIADLSRNDWQDSVELLRSAGVDLAHLAPVQMQFHYCAYTPQPDTSVTPRRCPKCGGASWEQLVLQGTLAGARSADRQHRHGKQHDEVDRPSADHELLTSDESVRFDVDCAAQQVYLALQHHDRSLGLITMRCLGGDGWEQVLRLEPGDYRYRYYVDDGRHLISYRPAAKIGSENGLDAELRVPERIPDCVLDHEPVEPQRMVALV
jgi:hypothetical protein